VKYIRTQNVNDILLRHSAISAGLIHTYGIMTLSQWECDIYVIMNGQIYGQSGSES